MPTETERLRAEIELGERRNQILKTRLRLIEILDERAKLEATLTQVEGIVRDLEAKWAAMSAAED